VCVAEGEGIVRRTDGDKKKPGILVYRPTTPAMRVETDRQSHDNVVTPNFRIPCFCVQPCNCWSSYITNTRSPCLLFQRPTYPSQTDFFA